LALAGSRSRHADRALRERGHPLLVYPTAAADFLENERFFLIKAIEPYIFSGRVQVYSIDSINRLSWMNDDVHPLERGRRQALYSRYVEEEVVPHIHREAGERRIAVTGASFGAFHAANQLLRRPDLFDVLIAMSGFYDLEPGYTEGHQSPEIYFNNPVSFLPGLEGPMLERLQNDTQIHLVTGAAPTRHRTAPSSSRVCSVANTSRTVSTSGATT
jgi:esterase/lipase superfamily enzyme